MVWSVMLSVSSVEILFRFFPFRDRRPDVHHFRLLYDKRFGKFLRGRKVSEIADGINPGGRRVMKRTSIDCHDVPASPALRTEWIGEFLFLSLMPSRNQAAQSFQQHVQCAFRSVRDQYREQNIAAHTSGRVRKSFCNAGGYAEICAPVILFFRSRLLIKLKLISLFPDCRLHREKNVRI